VIAIIGILIGMLLPAVEQVRAAACNVCQQHEAVSSGLSQFLCQLPE
jgi:hypothetical protein